MKTTLLNVIRNIFKINLLETTLRSFTQNKKPSSFIAKLVPNNYTYKIGTKRSFKYKDVNLELDIHDYLSHYLYFGFKDLSHEKLMSLIEKNNVVLDIGTNYGTTILQFAKLVGDNGLCFGFEPDPINYKICIDNINLNKFNNISVENYGLGNKKTELNLIVETPSNRGGNRIGNNINNNESHIVRITTMDNWVFEKKINKINLIKIDVEGYEFNVLKGGLNTLQKFKPILFIEVDDNNLKLQYASASELIAFLEQLNYNIFNAETNEIVSSKNNFFNCHFDIISMPKNN